MRKIILICLVLIGSVCLNNLVESFPLSNETSDEEDQNQYLTDLAKGENENENEYYDDANWQEEKLNDKADQNNVDENESEFKDISKRGKENEDLSETDEEVTDTREENSIFTPLNEDNNEDNDDGDYRQDKINNDLDEKNGEEPKTKTNECEPKLNDQNYEDDENESQIDANSIIEFPIQLSYDTVQALKKLFV